MSVRLSAGVANVLLAEVLAGDDRELRLEIGRYRDPREKQHPTRNRRATPWVRRRYFGQSPRGRQCECGAPGLPGSSIGMFHGSELG